MTKSIRELKKIVENYDADIPTGEYEVCPDCNGEGCINCEAGLNDVTGTHELPDFSDLKDQHCEYCHGTGYVQEVDPTTGESYRDSCTFCDAFLRNAREKASGLTEGVGEMILHAHRDEWPQMVILKRKLAANGVLTADLIPSHYGDRFIGVRFPSEQADIVRAVLGYYLEDEKEYDSWGARSSYSNSEYVGDTMPALTKYSVMDSKTNEAYSSPPPFDEMIKAGFPDVQPGDRIRTRKGNCAGVVTKLRVHPEKGAEEVFFTDDTGKKFKTPLSNVLKVTGMAEGRYDGEFEEDEPQFKDGDRVRLKPEYADSPSEVFWVSQCDPDRGRCWIGDEQGRGWYARFGQLELAKKKRTKKIEEAMRLDMVIDGIGYYYDYEEEEDNRKIWHYAVLPDGKEVTLDLSPYEHMDEATFKAFVDFYKEHGRFPWRSDIGSRGPIHREDVELFSKADQPELENTMQEATGDALDRQLARMQTPKYLEKRAIDQLKALPQPITINGGGYAYSANVKKNPYQWEASDGSPITIKKLKDLGNYFERYVQEDWDAFLDDEQDVEDLIRMGYLRTGSSGAYRGQADYEHKQMLGDAVGSETPQTIFWSMLQANRDTMRRVVKALGLELDGQGFDESSTEWQMVFFNDKKLTPDQWEDLLRAKVGELGSYGGEDPDWMTVESADDLYEAKETEAETKIKESKPLDKEVYNVAVRQIKDDIFGGFYTQYRVRIPKGQGDPKELVIAALKKHGIPEPFEIVALHKGLFNRKARAEHKLGPDQDVDKHWLLDNSEEKTMTEEADMARLLKLAGMYHKPQVFEMEDNKEGDQSPLSDVTDFVANIRGEKAKDPEKFNNADGEKSVLSEEDFEEGWDPFQDEYDDQSQEDFPGRSRRFANPGGNSSLYAAGRGNRRTHPCPTCGRENVLTARDVEAGYQCDRCADAAEGIGMGSYGESIEEESPFRQHAKSTGMKDDNMLPDPPEEIQLEDEVEEDYLEPPHQKDPHANEEADDWYDPEEARRQVARMGAHPEFTGKHELKPHDPVADQAKEDEWIEYQNAEQENMAAMDDWDVFNKQGVDEEGELGNGYGDNHVVDGEDFFPSGATSNVVRKVGPSGARHGDNPMSKVMATESAKLHEKYLRDFADFKKKMK